MRIRLAKTMASDSGSITTWIALLIVGLLIGGAAFTVLSGGDDSDPSPVTDTTDDDVTSQDGNQTTNSTGGDTTPPTNQSTTTCEEGFTLVGDVCVQDEDDDHEEPDDGHDHDHGTGDGTNETVTPEPDLPSVVLPSVPPVHEINATGPVNLEPFMHLATNTSVSIDLGVPQSALTVTPSLPAGLSISSEGVLSGTVATPARNVMVNFTTAETTQSVAFTFYDLTADHDTLTNDASATFGQGLTGSFVAPLVEAGLGYAQGKSGEGMMAVAYVHGSRIVAVPGEWMLVNEEGYAKHAALDAAIGWACDDGASVHLLIDNETLASTTALETDLVGLGYTVSDQLAANDCLLAAGLGPLESPDVLNAWLTGTRGAVLVGHPAFINSVNHGDAFRASAGGASLQFDFTEEVYAPTLNGLSAIEEVIADPSLSEEDLAVLTVRHMLTVFRTGYTSQIDGDSFGPSFMERLGAIVEEATWTTFQSNSPMSSASAGQNSRLLIKSAYLQNLPSDAGYVDVNAATYPGTATAPPGTQTVSVNLSDTVIAHNRGGPSGACSLGRVNKVLPVWANAGAEVVVTVPEALVDEGLAVFIGIHCFDSVVGGSAQHGYARSPSMVVAHDIVEVETRLTSGLGGLMMIAFPNGASLGVHDITVQNVSAAPHYLLGSTTAEQWAAQRAIDVPWTVMETPEILLALPSSMVSNWTDPSATLGFLDNGTAWMHWFHGVESTHHRQTIWYTDWDMDATPGAWMFGVDPIRSSHGQIVPDLVGNSLTTAVHWSILHEVAHLHEPASPLGMVEPWADFAVTAYFKMVHDLEIWETYKGPLMNRSNFVFSLDSYFENNGASGLGEYSGSPGYVLFWLIAEEHGYEAFQEAIVSMGAAGQFTNWDGWAIHLSQVTNQNMCTLFQAMSLDLSPNTVTACDAYAEWADHPIRNTGSAGEVEK